MVSSQGVAGRYKVGVECRLSPCRPIEFVQRSAVPLQGSSRGRPNDTGVQRRTREGA